ncbi:MAG: gene transfer agent family protein [Rhizobiaceae bacterium]|nr:gene transfer agent family protein [Rhizobiaceae bacterium]MCV0405480.1 gene transfer agent family protein [Rhizobiaceae bacterium]
MTANRHRGEIAAELDGRTWRLCLTLGALAELETAFAADDLNALLERFRDGRFASRDMIRILGAGLRGGGNGVSDDEVAAMGCADGAVGMARIVERLLAATFAPDETREAPANPR